MRPGYLGEGREIVTKINKSPSCFSSQAVRYLGGGRARGGEPPFVRNA